MRSVYDLKDGFHYGMHGCGYYAGTKYSNTYDGFKYWKSKGIKIIEVDMALTSDGKYVALSHKMDPECLRRLEIYDYSDKNAFSHAWFMDHKLFPYSTRGLKPLDLNLILEEMKHDEDLIIMMDLSGMWTEQETQHFANELMNLIGSDKYLINRIMVEAYNQGMIDGIKKGSNDLAPIIYCGRGSRKEGVYQFQTPQELLDQGIKIISYPQHFTYAHPGEIEGFMKKDFIVLSYILNEKWLSKMEGVNIALVDVLYTNGWDKFFMYPIYVFKRARCKIYQKVLRKMIRACN